MAVALLPAALLFAFGTLSAAAGIGGGAAIVVVFLYGGLSAHDAVPLSKAVVFCGTLLSALVGNAKGGGLVDYELVAAIVPPALGGTLLGVALNHVVPAMVILVLLVLTLVVTAQSTGQKLREQLEEEAKAPLDAEPPLLNPRVTDPRAQQLSAFTRGYADTAASVACILGHSALLCYVIFSGVAMRMSLDCYEEKRRNIDVPCESRFLRWLFGDWHDHPEKGFLTGAHGWHAAVAPGLICLALCALSEYSYHRLDVVGHRHPVRELAQYSCMAFCAGTLAGLVGIGGGLVFSPFMLFMRVDPAVAVQTSTFCVIFTSASTTAQYLFLGRVLVDQWLVFGPVYMLACLCGTTFTLLVQARKSAVTAVVLLAVLVSAALTLGQIFEKVEAQRALHPPVRLLELSHALLRRQARG